MENEVKKKLEASIKEKARPILEEYLNRCIELQELAVKTLMARYGIKIKENPSKKEGEKYIKKVTKFLRKNNCEIEIMENKTEDGKMQYWARLVKKGAKV